MILVTGGAGFIGSNLVAALEERTSQDIVICDYLGVGEKWQNISKRNVADIIPPPKIHDFLEKHQSDIQVIFHMGAISSTTEKDGDLIVENNIRLTLDLIEWCAQTEHSARLIYASSAATYGDGLKGFRDLNDEQSLGYLRPLNAYGWSKHLIDRRVAAYRRSGKKLPAQCAGLKFFNVYGPNEYHKGGQRSVAVALYEQIKQEGRARLFKSYHPDYKDGEQLRDFIWVGDCVEVMMWLYENPDKSGLFNVGTGKAQSFNELAHAVFNALNLPPRIDYIDMPEGLREKYQYYTEANLDNLKANGYTKPFKTLEEGVHDYITNYLDRDDSYR